MRIELGTLVVRLIEVGRGREDERREGVRTNCARINI